MCPPITSGFLATSFETLLSPSRIHAGTQFASNYKMGPKTEPINGGYNPYKWLRSVEKPPKTVGSGSDQTCFFSGNCLDPPKCPQIAVQNLAEV